MDKDIQLDRNDTQERQVEFDNDMTEILFRIINNPNVKEGNNFIADISYYWIGSCLNIETFQDEYNDVKKALNNKILTCLLQGKGIVVNLMPPKPSKVKRFAIRLRKIIKNPTDLILTGIACAHEGIYVIDHYEDKNWDDLFKVLYTPGQEECINSEVIKALQNPKVINMLRSKRLQITTLCDESLLSAWGLHISDTDVLEFVERCKNGFYSPNRNKSKN